MSDYLDALSKNRELFSLNEERVIPLKELNDAIKELRTMHLSDCLQNYFDTSNFKGKLIYNLLCAYPVELTISQFIDQHS